MLALCDDQGKLVVDGGRVEIRYKPTDSKAYRAAIGNLELSSAAALIADDAVVAGAPMDAAASKRPSSSRFKAVKSASVVHGAIPEGALVAYTDGACTGNPGPAGLGVVLMDGADRRELSMYLGHATNNIAELTAIEEALKIAKEPTRPLVIHTDSQYAIGVLSKGWKAKANQELIARIKATLKPFKKLELRYVKGHAGIPDNERADELARAAVTAQASSGWVKAR